MTMRAVLFQLKKLLALSLALSLVAAAPGTSGPIVYAASLPGQGASSRVQAWRTFFATFPSPATIQFLEPFGLSTPEQMEGFVRVMGRTGLDPQAVAVPGWSVQRQAALIQDSAESYAASLVARTAAFSSMPAATARQSLSQTQEEFRDFPVLVALVPGRRQDLERSRDAVASAVQAILAEPIERARAAWSDKNDDLAVQPAGGVGSSAGPFRWRLQKAPAVPAASEPSGSGMSGIPAPRLLSQDAPAGAAVSRAVGIIAQAVADIKALLTDLIGRWLHGRWSSSARAAVLAETDASLPPETRQSLQILGLTLAQFNRLVQAQTAFKRDLLAAHPELAQAFFSQRDQERFSKAVLSLTARRRAQGSAAPLAEALALAAQSFYGDVLASGSGWNLFEKGKPNEASRLMSRFAEFIGEPVWRQLQSEPLESRLLGIPVGESAMERRVARALLTNDPALFQEAPGSDVEFMAVLRRQARASGASLDVIYSHPFIEDRQLLGHEVPLEDGRLVFGLGELTRQIRAAQAESEEARLSGRPARRSLLVIKNVEALEPGVRTLLQSALQDREITHPDLGLIFLPDNLQFFFTIRKGVGLEDDSFYDRVAVRELPSDPSYQAPPGLQWPRGVDAGNYLDSVRLRQDRGRPVLSLPGAEISLSDEFFGVTPQTLHDEIYLKTGLILDFQTVRMLSMMAQVQARAGPLLRLEGPTGLGKTFAARGYARLLGRPFFSNPVSMDTQLSDWIGGFEQDEAGRYHFRGDTPLKQRLEQGGVAALSELNTLLDHNEKASLGWWLQQIVEAAPDAQGYRTIRLTEVPTPEGLPVPTIRVHPKTLIVVDTNPEGDYAARGALSDVLKERVPILSVEPLVTADASAALKRREIDTLRRDAEMFLKHDWTSGGRVLGRGLLDQGLRQRLARRLAEAYWEAAALTQSWKDPGGRVLSMRELRRMSEDVLAGLAAGRSEEAALGEAAGVHLGGWLTQPKQIEALRQALAAALGSWPPLQAQAALADQLLVKARPAHLRLPAQADAREALRRLAQDPAIELSLIQATEETDRFQMEGGLVPAESGTGLTFGSGIFARMIERANAVPDKTIVYVFDNAHNIKPEQIVAINEFLQDGLLYPKGARQPLSMPTNARVLFVSRQDSTLSWSPAERSRFVELAEGEDDVWAERSVAQELGQALSALPEQLAGFLGRWAAGLYPRLRQAEPNAPAGLLSQSSFLWFLRAATVATLAAVDAGLGVPELVRRLETAALGNLASWASPQRRQALALSQGLELVTRGYGSLRLGRRRPAGVEAGELPALEQARADFAIVATPADRAKALDALRHVLEAQAARLPWQEKSAADLRPLDIGRALALLPQDFPAAGVICAAITPDGQTLVIGSSDRKVRVFHLALSQDQYVQVGPALDHEFLVIAMALTADGRTLIVGSYDKKARVFRLEKNQYVQFGPPLDHDGVVRSMAIAPDGQTFVTGSEDNKARVFRLEPTQYVQVGPALDHDRWVISEALTADGHTLVTGSKDGKFRVFRIEQNQAIQVGPGLDLGAAVRSLAITPDGHTLVTLSDDYQVRVFRIEQNQSIQVGPAFDGGVVAFVAIAPDGHTLATGSPDKKVRLFHLDSSQNKYVQAGAAFEYGDAITSLALASDGRMLLVGGDRGLQIYALKEFIIQDDATAVLMDGRAMPRSQLAGPIVSLTEPDRPGAQAMSQAQADFAIAVTPADRAKALDALRHVLETQAARLPWQEKPAAELRQFDVGQALALLPQDFPVSQVRLTAITPDGRTIIISTLDDKILIFRLGPGQNRYIQISSAFDHPGRVLFLRITSDGQTFVTNSDDKNIRIFHLGQGQFIQAGPAFANNGYVDVAVTPDGRTIAISSEDNKTRVYRLEQNQYVQVGPALDGGSLAITPDGRTLLMGRNSPTVRVVRLEQDRYVQVGPALDCDASAHSSAITPDGQTFALGSYHAVLVFRSDSSQNKYIHVGSAIKHDALVESVDLTSDGLTLATGNKEAARVFSFDPRQKQYVQAGSAIAHGGFIRSVAFTPDGRMLLVGGVRGLQAYSLQKFIVQDDAAVVLMDGRVVSRSQLAGRVAVVAESEAVHAVMESASFSFKPRYGGKPFYFAADEDGRVWLNFKGRWLATRHELVRPLEQLGQRPRELASVSGRRRDLAELLLADLKDPYAEALRPLSEDDFLMEGETLERLEGLALEDWSRGRAVNFIGSPGAGKTVIARELGLLLGLPRFVFQMNGERELSDLLGAFREDPDGRLVLTARPVRDAQGRQRFKLPLLDMIVNGGIFVLDEGAIGERGRELLSWFSGLANGDREIVLQEFPGSALRLPVHKDFGLVVTNNRPEDTPGRLQPKSEVTANVHTIEVPEDDEPATLERLFKHFLGQRAPADPRDVERWGKATAALHHLLKPAIGRQIGRDNKERYYLSKREVRRVAAHLRRALREDPRGDADKAFERALRAVYEAMFSHLQERAYVRERIEKVLGRPIGADGLREELAARFPRAATEREAWAAGLTQDLLSQGEPVLYIAEAGARTSDMARAAAEAMGARLEPVDAAPEQGELELLGGWLPHLGERPAGAARSRQVRGKLTRYLLTRAELEQLGRDGKMSEPVVLWLRNVDQWKEEIRTALNGLLEDGFIDLEDIDGRATRLYRPPHLHLLAEMPADSTRDFSAAFFSRWVKIGIPRDLVLPEVAGQPSEFERVLRSRYALDTLDAHWTAELRAALSRFDAERRWVNRGAYQYHAGIFFALAQAVVQARNEDPRWAALFDRVAAEGYDPRRDPWAEPKAHRSLVEDYRSLATETFAREARRLVAARLPGDASDGEIPDAQRFEQALAAVLGFRVADAPVALATDDGTLDGRLVAAGGVPVRESMQAEGLRPAARDSRVFLSPQIERALGILARADNLGMATVFAGETGAVKTSICALWARLTGRRFYKYQVHGGSEASDLTIDFEQEASGAFRKRVKDFYRLLREGRVIMDIDEANLAPWVLWTLEPLLRGERWVHPIFPEEPAFMVGEGVQIVMTFNPTRYSGRQTIDPRLLDHAITAWVGLASSQEIEKVVASFYGVWEQPAAAAGAVSVVTPAPALAGHAPEGRKGTDDLMRDGQETFDENSSPHGPRGDAMAARGIFIPELFPYTRLSAYDVYDEASEEWTRLGNLTAEDVPRLSPGQADALARELKATHDLFAGRVAMSVGAQWQGLPATGPGMRFIDLAAFDAAGRPTDPGLELARDSADNFYVRARQTASVELRYRVAVPAVSFGSPLPAGLPFHYPAQIPAEVRQALGQIGLKDDETDYRVVLHALAAYFRDFSLKKDGIVGHGGSRYLDIMLSKCGVCRHRAFAFARTALGLGIPARYVESEIHAWAEVLVPNLGWMRVDLGGGGDPMNMDLLPLANDAHVPRYDDGLPSPKTYRENEQRMAERTRQAMKQQGLKPPHSSRGQASAGSDSGGGAAEDSQRIQAAVDGIDQELVQDARLNDELAPLFSSGKGDTQFVFDRMLRALRDAVRIEKIPVRSGLEIDPQALIQRKPKPFVKRRKQEKMSTTAISVLLDFSGSMGDIKQQLAYTIGAVGENFWKLREAAPEHFFYDLASFSDAPHTYVAMDARLSRKENADRLVNMANAAGEGGTDIVRALNAKLSDFMGSRQARGAKVKSLLLVTDGADGKSIVKGPGGQWTSTPEMAQVLAQCAEAGIDVTFIGIGPAAEQVKALDGSRQHYVRIDASRSEDIAEVVAKLAELNGRGARLPDGELNAVMQIIPPVY